MNDKRYKYIQWLLYALLGIGGLLGIIFYLNSDSSSVMNNLITFMYIVGIVALLSIVSAALISLFQSPKGGSKLLLSIVALVVVAILCYVFSKNEFDIVLLEKWNITAGFSKSVGAAIYFLWIMLIATFGSLIYSAVIRFFK